MIWRHLSFALIKSDEMTFVSFNLSLKEKHKRKEEERRRKEGWKERDGRVDGRRTEGGRVKDRGG